MTRFFLLSFALISCPTLSPAEVRFLCETTHAVGVKLNLEKKQWENASFQAGQKYIVAPPNREPISTEFRLVVTELGKGTESFRCSDGFSDHGFLSCDGFGGTFTMNRNSLRFQEIYRVGYVISDLSLEGPDNTPFLAIGVCSPF